MAATEIDLLSREWNVGPRVSLAGPLEISADGNGTEYAGTSDLELDAFNNLIVGGSLIAKRGGVTISIYVETRTDDEDTWTTAASWTGLTAKGALDPKIIDTPDKRIRVRWDITGAGSFTLFHIYMTPEGF